MIDTIGGRKVLVSVIVILVGIALVALKGDVPGNMLQLLMAVAAAFIGGNAVEHVADAVATRKEPQEAPVVQAPAGPDPALVAALNQEFERINGTIVDLQGKIEAAQGAVSVTQEALKKVLDARKVSF